MRFDSIPRELLERCRSGASADGARPPEEAFDELCRLLQPDLYAFLFSLLRNHDDTDEVLVECLVRLHRHIGGLQDLDRFPGWLLKMAVNQVQTHRARYVSRMTAPLDDMAEIPNERLAASARPAPSPRAALEQREIRAEIDTAMASLPPRQRETIVLYEIEQLSVREIASILECSEGAVKFNLHEARRKLRQRLGHLLEPARREAGA